MKTIPEKIYLQVDGEPWTELGGITWCQDKINDTDVEYVIVDMVNRSRAANKNLLDQIIKIAIANRELREDLLEARKLYAECKRKLEETAGLIHIPDVTGREWCEHCPKDGSPCGVCNGKK